MDLPDPKRAVRVLVEETRQALRRDVGSDVGGIDACASGFDRVLGDVGRKDLDLGSALAPFQLFVPHHGDRVRLLAGRAAADPDPEGPARRVSAEKGRKRDLLEGRECLGIPEVIGDADQEVAKERVQLGGIALQHVHVFGGALDLFDRHPPLHPPGERARLVLREVVSGPGAKQDARLLDDVLAAGLRFCDRYGVSAKARRTYSTSCAGISAGVST